METGFIGLAIVILIATTLGIFARLTKQPLILAFIATGALISYLGFFNLDKPDIFKLFADLGIMFLLFLIGMEINYTSLKMVGKTSVLVGIGQIIFTSAIGFLIAFLFDFSYLHSAYIAIALTFSSTIIVVKILSEKKDLNSLYGKISIGFLLIQDFVAILILLFLAGIETGEGLNVFNLIITVLKGIFLFILMFWLGRKLLPLLFDKISRSQELLFLASLAWVFLIVAGAGKLGFSIEIGGFLAGLALANSSEHYQIANRIKSLRDFFILIFFVILGSSIIFSDFSGLALPIIIFSLFVLIGNPLIVLVIMGLMGHRKRTSFLCGVTVAQISEFSLVLAALGLKVGHLSESIVALITAVGIITITLSTYMMIYSNGIYNRISKLLSIFERKKLKESHSFEGEIRKPIILIGSHRVGQSIAFNLKREDVLIIDFDPEVIDQLKKSGYEYLFGDISDEDLFDRAHFSEAKLIISTVPDIQDSLYLTKKIREFRKEGSRVKLIVRARNMWEVDLLYKEGADYVIFPHFTSGQYLGKSIAIDPEMKIIDDLREWDINTIKKLNHRHNHSNGD